MNEYLSKKVTYEEHLVIPVHWGVRDVQAKDGGEGGVVGLLREDVVVHVLHVPAHPLGGLLVVGQEPRVSPEVDGRQLLLKGALARGVVVEL